MADDTAAERARVTAHQDAGFGHVSVFERRGPIPGATLNPQGDVHRQLTRAVKFMNRNGVPKSRIVDVLQTTEASVEMMFAQPDS